MHFETGQQHRRFFGAFGFLTTILDFFLGVTLFFATGFFAFAFFTAGFLTGVLFAMGFLVGVPRVVVTFFAVAAYASGAVDARDRVAPAMSGIMTRGVTREERATYRGRTREARKERIMSTATLYRGLSRPDHGAYLARCICK